MKKLFGLILAAVLVLSLMSVASAEMAQSQAVVPGRMGG